MMKKGLQSCLAAICVMVVLPFATANVSPGDASEEMQPSQEQEFIYTVPINGAVELALRNVIGRALREANRNNAKTIILEIDTLGGRLDAAVEISKMLSGVPQETVAFVNTRAISAGALIALSCKRIVMSEGATMGAATPVQLSPTGDTQPTDEKAISYVRAEFRSAAERNGHPPNLAEAMVDKDISIEGVTDEGKLLTLDARQALELRVAESLVENKQGLLSYLNKESAQEFVLEEYWMEQIARFFANPMISGFLMMLGLLS
ncbi:MAG TPA: ATP-dependent Clp protease proteolytic subunit, partial [bacterium]|nr:ATP-dependent Clp protease proteolytic subunit [bacterium]